MKGHAAFSNCDISARTSFNSAAFASWSGNSTGSSMRQKTGRPCGVRPTGNMNLLDASSTHQDFDFGMIGRMHFPLPQLNMAKPCIVLYIRRGPTAIVCSKGEEYGSVPCSSLESALLCRRSIGGGAPLGVSGIGSNFTMRTEGCT